MGIQPTRGILLLWQEHFPRLYRELQELGELEEIAESVHEQAGEQRADLIRRGVPPETADELVAELWLNPAGLLELSGPPPENADEDGD